MKERLFVIASQRSIGKTWWVVGEKAGPRSRKYLNTWSFRTRAEVDRNAWPLGRGPRTTAISSSGGPCSDRPNRSIRLSRTIGRHVVLIAFTRLSSAGLRPAGPAGGPPASARPRPESPALCV